MKKLFLLFISSLSISSIISCADFDKEVVILFTNDTHGEINKKISFANAGKMKQNLQKQNKSVLLLDSGDSISGGFYTTYDKGKCMIDLMNMAGYDATTLGNHEFDYDFTYLDELISRAKFPFISTNFYHMKNGVPTTRYTDLSSKIFEFRNAKVGVLGISTPESITTSTPSHFQDEKGNYIYTFMDNNLYDLAQKEIDTLKESCDYIICLSHLGDKTQDKPFTASKLAKNTSGIDVILDGHTHFAVPGITVKDKKDKDVFITQAGGKFKNIGKLTINKKGIKNVLINENKEVDENIKETEKYIINDLDNRLKKEIATTDIDFTLSGKQEDNLGDLVSESTYYYYNVYLPEVKHENTQADISFVNSGGLRSNIDKGTITLKSCKNLLPFGNETCLVKLKGKILKDALEFSSYKIPDYFGGLQEICGVQYRVNPNIVSDIKVDANNDYVSGPSDSHRRLSEIKIFDKESKAYLPLDDNKEYYLCGSAYVLLEGGDGFSLFRNNVKFVRKEVDVVDYDVLVNYISNFKKENNSSLPVVKNENSPLAIAYPELGINYVDPGYGKRIIIEGQ